MFACVRWHADAFLARHVPMMIKVRIFLKKKKHTYLHKNKPKSFLYIL